MALKAFHQYLQTEELPNSIQSHALKLQSLIGDILDSGFSDISLNNYLIYLIHTSQIDLETYSSIDSIIVAKIHEMANQKVIDTGEYLKLISLMEFIKANASDLSSITVQMFKNYVVNQIGFSSNELTISESIRNTPISFLELGDSISLLEDKYNIRTIDSLINHIRSVKTGRFDVPSKNNGIDYQLIIAKLVESQFLDRVEAGLLLRLIYRYQVISINELLGENLSTEYPELDLLDLGMLSRHYNPLKRFGFSTIGELKWELLNGAVPFLVYGLGDKSIIAMTSSLAQSGFLSQAEIVNIYTRFVIKDYREG